MNFIKKYLIEVRYKLHIFYNNIILSNLKKPTIASIDESLDYIIKNNVSVSRFGDGELTLINMHDIGFQHKDKKLSDRLQEILKCENSKIAICIPMPLNNYNNLNATAAGY